MRKEITKSGGIVLDTAGKYCAEDITVGVKLQELNVTSSGRYTADEGYAGIGKVNVNVQGGGGATLNVEYSQTPPSDTTKLWIKSEQPENITFETQSPSKVDFTKQLVGLTADSTIYGQSCVAHGEYIFTLGGRNTGAVTKIQQYNIKSGTRTVLSSRLSQAAYGMGCAVVGDIAYLIGGNRGVATGDCHNYILKFNLSSKSVNRIMTFVLPVAIAEPACAAVGKNIYIFGGRAVQNEVNIFQNTIQVLNTENETITTLTTTLPYGISEMASAVIGNKIYLFGGNKGDSYSDKIFVFDTDTQTLTLLEQTLSQPLGELNCAMIGKMVYILGGRNSAERVNTIQQFDSENNTITTLQITLPIEKSFSACATIGEEIYLIGGFTTQKKRTNTITVFGHTFPLENGKIVVLEDCKRDAFEIFSTPAKVKVGVDSVYKGNADGNAELLDAYLYLDGEWKNVSYR